MNKSIWYFLGVSINDINLRVINRLAWYKGSDKIEAAKYLKEWLPNTEYFNAYVKLTAFGQLICKGYGKNSSPDCRNCPNSDTCAYNLNL